MKFSRSLKLNHVFRRLYAKGSCVAGRYLVLYCKRNGLEENRVGITVSKKLGRRLWQKGFHDHVIRDDWDFERRWRYIEDNPRRWAEDPERSGD